MSRHWTGDPHRHLVLAPGRNYTADAPLLWFARVTALDAGWSVTDLTWDQELLAEKPVAHVNDVVTAALDERPAGLTVVLAKSVGTMAVSAAADRGLPGIWLTPLLTNDHVRAQLPDLRGPQLHVGGTGDPVWAREHVPGHHQVLEVPGADHALHAPGDTAASLEILRTVTERVAAFLETCRHGTATA
ncbi:hypothetical protein Afil01_51210 [Actinorhabdospora filicis]|uniref:Alpha/beta hydrolase n=1 Tax=Actinorhabdospora filicis TaxID=1785913 RepID=A0A9W6WB61_9ACTN|nr:alpha/beta hydrolase [Actinorhabdospora filicis]GLZ80314.1 hypothetical protein Afil01_51210 [Actinorhabdospora filicis]